MKLTVRNIKAFQTMIFLWWRSHRRDLPWRKTRNPYRILVSEIMLQQTQVSRVLPKYLEFIKAYPTVEILAGASAADVLRIWKGMGYNRRALYLKKAAQKIDEQGRFPDVEQELTKLPGVGTYTARAILVFAFNKQVPMVDTNIRKIITHFFYNDVEQEESVIVKAAERLLPRRKAWEWHQALMDYGAIELPGKMKLGKGKNKSAPFVGSRRYYRGKLIDMLRNGPVRKRALKTQFSDSIIERLLAEGLIAEEKNYFTLPS